MSWLGISGIDEEVPSKLDKTAQEMREIEWLPGMIREGKSLKLLEIGLPQTK